jgi:aspartate/methionine/tyrosine aminotransferase
MKTALMLLSRALGNAPIPIPNGDEPFFPALIDAVVYLAATMKPLYLERYAFDIEPLIDALTQRVRSDAAQIFLYPNHHLDLI